MTKTKILEHVSSAYRDDADADPSYRFTYKNSAGEMCKFFGDRIEFHIKTRLMSIRYKEIDAVKIDPDVKSDQSTRNIIIETSGKKYLLCVDTKTDNGLDIFPLYRQLSRLVTSSR